ncbi:MAG: hypothetical protein ABII79_09900 [bacterium]
MQKTTRATRGQNMIWILVLIYCGICAALCSVVADAKNYHPSRWAILGFLTGIFGLIAIVGMPQQSSSAVSEGKSSEIIRRNEALCSLLATAKEPREYVLIVGEKTWCPHCIEPVDSENADWGSSVSVVCGKCGGRILYKKKDTDN